MTRELEDALAHTAALEAEIERLRDGVGSLTLMIAARDTEIERLQKEWAILQKDWTICWEGCGELRAEIERLRAALQQASYDWANEVEQFKDEIERLTVRVNDQSPGAKAVNCWPSKPSSGKSGQHGPAGG